MKVLLDTNIIIHREDDKIYKLDIGQLFYWLNKLKHDKYIHPLALIEINRYKDQNSDLRHLIIQPLPINLKKSSLE